MRRRLRHIEMRTNEIKPVGVPQDTRKGAQRRLSRAGADAFVLCFGTTMYYRSSRYSILGSASLNQFDCVHAGLALSASGVETRRKGTGT